MFAIILDENNYLQSFSNKFRKPGSILAEVIPKEADPEKLRCYMYADGKFVFDAEKWAAIEAERAENTRINEITQEIADAEDALQKSMYSVIEYVVCFLTGTKPEHDIKKLHAERKALTEQINALKNKLKTKE